MAAGRPFGGGIRVNTNMQEGAEAAGLSARLGGKTSRQGGACPDLTKVAQQMVSAPDITLDALVARVLTFPEGARHIVAIAGAPGSGKSTTAEQLVDTLNAARPGRAALLPMDGYHYDDVVLRDMGRHPWKGAPDTFDVGGLRSVLGRLRARDEATVAVPVFDRSIEIARAGGRLVPQSARIIVAEGNYLLLSRTPWDSLALFFDFKVLIAVPEEVLRDRLGARWVHYGLTTEGIRAKLEENDLPNGRVVMDESIGADVILRT
jgi:pantothenate kinase